MIRPRLLRLAATRLPGALPAGPAPLAVAAAAAASLTAAPSPPAPSASPSLWSAPRIRGVHTFPEAQLEYQHGIPELLSAKGFKLAWTDYQKLLITRLNSMLSGTELEEESPLVILTKVARDPGKAHIFNHASMIFNNHFFFSGLTNKPTPVSPELKRELEVCFGSMENLRREMVISALSMFGPGFVWLVRVLDKRVDKNMSETGAARFDFRILPTYLAGSPFADAHWRRQSVDMNTSGEVQWRQGPLPGQPMAAYQSPTPGTNPAASPDAPRNTTAPGGANVVPVLCINTWEHVWLTDYGFGDSNTDGKLRGKNEYVLRWWNAINWERVRELTMPSLRRAPAV